MERETQLSAIVSPVIKAQLEKFVRATGMKKGRVIQDALAHHLAALEALPPDVIIPARIVLTKESMREVAERVSHPPKPTRALRKLMKDHPDTE